MEISQNIEFFSKIILIGISLVLFIIKIKSFFAESRRKQDFKIDLEILNLTIENKSLNSEKIRKNVEDRIEKLYDSNSLGESPLADFIMGLVVFFGFGYWSIVLFQTSSNFNPWIILTLFLSAAGLILMVFGNKPSKHLQPFLTIRVYDKINLKFATAIIFIFGSIMTILFISEKEISVWIIICAIFFFLGISTFFRNIKIK